jgi:hypothetical protein
MSMPLFHWAPHQGLRGPGATVGLTNTGPLEQCLAHIGSQTRPALFYLRDCQQRLEDTVIRRASGLSWIGPQGRCCTVTTAAV